MSRTLPVLLRRFLLPSVVCLFVFGAGFAYGYRELGSLNENRAKLLAYMLKQHLETHHFSHKKIDDSLSEAAFGLFLKQLDFQKRFLLKGDVKKLRAHSDKIDDEIAAGTMELAIAGDRILSERVGQLLEVAKDILSQDFDFSQKEYIETDVEKIDYCASMEELKERWRKTLKYQVLHEYLFQKEEESQTKEAGKGEAGEEKGKEPVSLQESARKKVLKNYETLFTRILQEKERELYNRYFGAVTRAFDPHTVFMPPDDKEDFDISMRGSFEGIGATLEEKDGYIRVVSIIPGGPAFLQGQLEVEDIILKVAEGDGKPVDLTDMRVRDAVKLIRGKKGSEVRLTVRKPEGKRIVVPIVRDVVQLSETFAKGATLKHEKSGKTFGYVRLPSFYRDFEKTAGGKGHNATDDVRNELKKMESEGISGLVLDLRNNGGGALADAISITGLFIKTGPVVQVKNSYGKVGVLADEDPDVSYSGPMVVLVDKFSASASEILAGALQDYGRAVIVGGEHTHGKGTVQSILPLDYTIPLQETEERRNLGALKVTVQKFYRISGESTQYRGVLPDIVLPDRWSILKSGERHLDYALPWDAISPAQFTKVSPLPADLSDLRGRSEKRMKESKQFAELRKDIEKAAERRKKTLRSLHINDARKEREEEKADRKDRDADDPDGHVKSGKTARARMSEGERRQLWIKDLGKDAYVQEAIAVLTDIASSISKVSAK